MCLCVCACMCVRMCVCVLRLCVHTYVDVHPCVFVCVRVHQLLVDRFIMNSTSQADMSQEYVLGDYM